MTREGNVSHGTNGLFDIALCDVPLTLQSQLSRKHAGLSVLTFVIGQVYLTGVFSSDRFLGKS